MTGRRIASLVLIAALGGCGGSAARQGASASSAATSTTAVGTTGTGAGAATTVAGTSPGVGTTSPHPSPSPTTGSPATGPGAPGPATTGPATTGPGPAGCAVGPQAAPAATISANFPTALAFAPDGRLFFAERSGTVRVFQGGHSKVFATVPTTTTEQGGGYSERGLLGLAVDPNFNQNRFVYAFYSDANHTQQRVIRWADCAGTGTQGKILLTFPSGSDCCHKGGRLAFGPDGKLYVTLGDEHATNGQAAQDTADVRGKVLRYNSDGTIPGDNPFGAGNPVWAYGLRNPFGIAFSAGGQLAITNNGPSGEIPGGPATGYDTIIFAAARGAGYQWPNCYGYSHLNPGVVTCGVGLLPPDWSSEANTVVPTGATFVDGSGPAGYAGHLVLCSYAGGGLIFTPGSPQGSVAPGPANCRLDIKEGPNHALYFADDGHIYRLG